MAKQNTKHDLNKSVNEINKYREMSIENRRNPTGKTQPAALIHTHSHTNSLTLQFELNVFSSRFKIFIHNLKQQ